MIYSCVEIKFDNDCTWYRKIDELIAENVPMPKDSMYINLVSKDSETGKILTRRRLFTNEEIIDESFELDRKFYIRFNFFDKRSYVLGTDDPTLNGRYIPKYCASITLFTRDEYQQEINNALMEIEDEKREPELIDDICKIIYSNDYSKKKCDEICNKLKELIDMSKRVIVQEHRRKIYFGQKIPRKTVDAFTEMFLFDDNNDADGAILCDINSEDAENLDPVYYYDWELSTGGELNEKRRLIYDKVLEYVEGEEEEEKEEDIVDNIEPDNVTLQLEDILEDLKLYAQKYKKAQERRMKMSKIVSKDSDTKKPNENNDN